MIETRHPELLEEIKEKNNGWTDEHRRLDQIAVGSIQTAQGSDQGIARGDETTESSDSAAYRVTRRPDEQSLGASGSDVNEPESSNSPGTKVRRKRLKDLSPEEIAEREEIRKEKDRERKRQQRALADEAKTVLEGQKETEGQTVQPSDPVYFESSQAQNPQTDRRIKEKPVQNSQSNQSNDVLLKLKGKKVDLSDVKLITGSEAEDKIEKLTDLFVRGSNILDQFLQIIVKGHEEVSIWTLDDDTARIFATMQVEKAKKDKEAAHTVHRLIAIHEKMFAFTVFAPRIVASVVLMRNKGLGFK